MTIRYPTLSLALVLACGGDDKNRSEDTAPPLGGDDTGDTSIEDTGEPTDPVEVCNGRDDDGDGLVDEGMFGRFWNDGLHAAWHVEPSVAAVLSQYDEWSNGDIDSESVALYNLDGQIIEHKIEASEGDTHTTIYSRGAGGNLNQEQYLSNGKVYMEIDFTWDGDLMTSRTQTSFAEDGTATLLHAVTWTFDGDGYQLTQEEDSNGDGEVNNIMYTTWSGDRLVRTDDFYVVRLASFYQIIRTTYSASGKIISEETDANADGTFDQMQTYVYNDNEWLMELIYIGPDGEPTSRDTYEYDETGHLLWMNITVDDAGNFSASSGYEWDGDSVLELRSRDNDGAIQAQVRYTLDPAGNTAMGIEDPDDLTDSGTHTTTYSFTCH